MQNLRRVGESSDTILSRFWTNKFTKFSDDVGSTLYILSDAFSDCLYHVSFLLPITWQSLVEFRLPMSVCEAWL